MIHSNEGYLYTHHQIEWEDGIIKQTRSSPNWLGGVFTYSTCKHQMRTYKESVDWIGRLLVGLNPRQCGDNCILYIGVVNRSFHSNYHLGLALKKEYPIAYKAKQANTNPRADLYEPKRSLVGNEVYSHQNYNEPPNHTRSTEYYKSSPGSQSNRPDGCVPKWWRDIEYVSKAGKRPPSFTLDPVWIYKEPLVWTTIQPGRASVKVTPRQLVASLQDCPVKQ